MLHQHQARKVMGETHQDGVVAMPKSTDLMDQVLSQILNAEETVHIKNKEEVEKRIQRIILGGHEHLQVISDFDRTISRSHHNGAMCPPSAGVLRNSPLMPEEFRIRGQQLFQKYYPFERSTELTHEEKEPLIIEWYEAAQLLTVQTGIDKAKVEQVVRETNTCLLRDNVDSFFKVIHMAQVPCLIFSAGTGDVIQLIMEMHDLFFPNIRIISNWMEFDKVTGQIIGFSKPMIHVFNKNESILGDHPHWMDLEHRKNVILLGDNLADVEMDKGIQNPGAIIKIGFLNDKVEEFMASYLEEFDVVLVNDQTFDFPNALMKVILEHQALVKKV